MRVILMAATLAAGAATGTAQEDLLDQQTCPAKNWIENKPLIEEFLETADVVEIEPTERGVLKPQKATLRRGALTLNALWKSLERGRHPRTGQWESWQGEVVAYELDKILGLDMVPPTVARRVEGNMGSLQLWIDGCRLYNDVMGQKAGGSDWGEQMARTKAFDNLILNTDRNGGNLLVDSDWHVVLIDHSQVLRSSKNLLKTEADLPEHFDRRLVERMRVLTYEDLKPRFDELLMDGQIKAIIARRDKLMERLDELVAERGEAAVYFGSLS